MKTKIVLLLLFFTTITQAQFVQSINKNYDRVLKMSTNKTDADKTDTDKTDADKTDADKTDADKTDANKTDANKTSTKKTFAYATPYHKLLGIKDSAIDPFVAARLRNHCIEKINSLYKERNSLVEKGDLKPSDSVNHRNNTLNKKSLEITKNIEDYKKARDYFGAINSLDGSPKFLRKFFPLRSIAQAQLFYLESTDGEKKVSFIKDVSYQNNFEGSNTLNTSLFTAVFPLFTRYAPLKINIASTISQNNDSIPENKIADKVAKGGLFNIGATYTLFYSNWKYYDNHAVTVYLPIETRLHMDDIKDKANLKDTFFYNEFSGSVFISFDLLQSKTDADLATLFIATKYSWFDGGSKFLEKIQENKFSLLQLNAGIKIANKFTLAVNIPLKSSSTTFLDKQSSTIALVFDTGN
jgi:hypothetical protein